MRVFSGAVCRRARVAGWARTSGMERGLGGVCLLGCLTCGAAGGGSPRGYKAGARLCAGASCALGGTLSPVCEQCVAGPLGLILAHGAGLSGCKIAFPTSSKQMQPGHRRTQHCSSTNRYSGGVKALQPCRGPITAPSELESYR